MGQPELQGHAVSSDRQEEILALARQSGRVLVDDLATRLDVTPQTIRKDLNDLCERGFLSRVHGGAVVTSGVSNLAYDARRFVALTEKQAIGVAAASEYFAKPITETDVVWTYSGVRPLYDDGASKAQEATRDYVLTLDARQDAAPLLSVFGGKITTYRRLAEAALEKLAPHLPKGRTGKAAGWTGGDKLPGGDFPVTGLEALTQSLAASHPYLTPAHARRLARTYGTRAINFLGGARSFGDLGQSFGADLTEAEVRYLMREEWATTADDVLWRRTKLGLRISQEQKTSLAAFMAKTLAEPSAAMAGAA